MFESYAKMASLIILITLVGACGPAATAVPPTATVEPPPPTTMPPTAAVPPPTPLPEDGTRGKIAFYSVRDGNAEIYIMNADGSNLERLTSNSAEDVAPSVSPDGTRIAFMSTRDGNNEIYVMHIDGVDPQRLTNTPAYESHPAWSPDGTRIAFVSEREGNREIYVMDADGSNVQRLTDDQAEDMRPSWSPDAARIAFSRMQDENWDVYVMDANGHNLQRLTESDAGEFFPAWSPDGSQIAYMSSVQRGSVEIRLMDVDGSNDHPLPGIGRVNEDPAWSPDGTQIVFQSNRDGNWEIYVMDADGSNQRRLTDNPAGDYWPSWGPSPAQAPGPPTSSEAAAHRDLVLNDLEGLDNVIVHTHVCGFLIITGGKRILIDSLFQVDSPPTPAERVLAMQQGLPPFNDLDLILVTHDHHDHFDANLVGSNMRNNPDAVFVSTDVVVNRLRSQFSGFAQIQDRVIGVHLEQGGREQINVAGVDLEIFSLSHGTPTVPNFGYYFTMDGMSFFHTGDMDPEHVTVADLQAYGLPEKEIDIAFVSGFRLTDERFSDRILEGIRPKVMVPMHFNFSKTYDNAVLREIEASFRDVILFREEMTWQAIDLGILR